MFRIAVCDDNQMDTEKILDLIAQFKNIHPGIDFYIESFHSSEKLLNDIREREMYDLFLLDVLMPEINGIELAGNIRVKNPDVPIVFLTNSIDYSLSAYNVSALQYMLKPIKKDAFFSILDKILAFRKLEKDNFFMFSTQEGVLKISFHTIVYIELKGHIMTAHLNNNDILSSKNIKVSFQTAIALLLEDSRFLYAHRSYLINMDYVEELIERTFTMKYGYSISIPKYRIAEAKKKYFEYLSRCGVSCLGGKCV